jgi:alpha-glucuronidase
MLLRSREIYEKYTSFLGIGWMVRPGDHYGPSVDGYEYSRWGTYHRADHLGIGVDRTDRGTGYAQQYYRQNAEMYNDPETCPEELLLFFHHIPYTYKLKSGKTLIQYIYDSHFEGEKEAEELSADWKGLEPYVPDSVFERVSERFDRQITNAREWRDQVNSYFFRKSGIPDEKGRQIW